MSSGPDGTPLLCVDPKQSLPVVSSSSKFQLLQNRSIPFVIGFLQVVQQSATLADELKQSATAVMVFGMCTKMFVKITKPFGEQRDLDFGRPCVTLVAGILSDDLLFTFFFETHTYIHLLSHVGPDPSEPPVDIGMPRLGYLLRILSGSSDYNATIILIRSRHRSA